MFPLGQAQRCRACARRRGARYDLRQESARFASRKNVCDAVTGKQLLAYDPCEGVFFSHDSRFLSAGNLIVDLVTKAMVTLPLAPREKWRRDGDFVVFPARSRPLGFLRERNALVVLHTGEKKQRAGFSGTAIESAASVKSYEAATGKETVHEFKVREGYRILAAALCEISGRLAVATAKPMNSSIWVEKDDVEVWDQTRGGRKFFPFEKLDEKAAWSNEDLQDLQFSPDGATLAVITRDNLIRLCDPATGQLRVKVGPLWPRYWAFSADSKMLLALPRNGTMLHVWDTATGKLLANPDIGFAGHAESLDAQPEVAFSPDGKTYAAGGGSKFVELRDTLTGAVRATFLGHQHPIRDLTFSPDGKTLATADVAQRSPDSESNVKLWDAAEEMPIGLPLDTSLVTELARSPDGQTMAVGFANGTIRLCEAGSLEVRSLLRNKSTKLDVLQFSADGKQLAASHRGEEKENNIDVWDVASGKVVASFPGYLRALASCQTSWQRTLVAAALRRGPSIRSGSTTS